MSGWSFNPGGSGGGGSITTPISAANGGFGESMAVQTYSGGDTATLPSGNIKVTQNLVNVSGIVAGTFDGQLTYVLNSSTAGIFFLNQNGGAPAANRIINPGAAFAVTTSPGDLTVLRYDTSVSRWRLVQTGTVRAASNPMQLSGGLISILTASTSQAGALSNTDYNTFLNGRLGLLNFSIHGVPYLEQLSPYSVKFNSSYVFDETKIALGVGIAYADLAATVHAKSDIAQTIADPISFTANLVLWGPPTSPSFTLSPATPDIQRVTASGTPSNLGGGGYSPSDVVDYLITAGYDDGSNPIVWGVSFPYEIIGVGDPSAFDIDVVITPGTQNFTTNVWSISRQVNAGGFNDYQRFTSASFTDTNSGWTGGADDLSNKADDFLADGSNPQVDAYGTKQSPIPTTIYSSSAASQTYVDGGSGDAYKLQFTITGAADAPYEISWPGTRNYQTSVDFTSGPVGPTNSGPATTTPNSYGYLSDGSALNRSYDLVDYDSANGVFSVNPINQTTSDPNDGLYYYVDLIGDTGAFLGKLVRNNTTDSLTTTPAGSFHYYDDGVQTFPGNSVITPTSYYSPVQQLEAHGTVTNNIPSSIFKAIDTSGEQIYHSFRNHSDTEIGSIKVNASGMKLDASNFNINAAVDGIINYNNANRLYWSANGGLLIGPDAAVKLEWNSSGVKIGPSGTAVRTIFSAAATLDFPSVAAGGGTQDLTITVTGAAVGDVVSLGLPAAPDAGIVYTGWVSATNTVTVRATNTQTVGAIDPASATFRAMVTHF